MIDPDLKVLIDFTRFRPEGKHEEYHLNRLNTLVQTAKEGQPFAPLQLESVEQLSRSLSSKALGTSKIILFFLRIFRPQAVAKIVARAVEKYVDTVFIAHYNPWMYEEYFPGRKTEAHLAKAENLLKRAKTLHQLFASVA